MALIVIHRHHQVEVSPRSSEEKRIGRQRTLHIPPLRKAGINRRLYLLSFLASTEKPILARMRIDATHSDARIHNARLLQPSISIRLLTLTSATKSK